MTYLNYQTIDESKRPRRRTHRSNLSTIIHDNSYNLLVQNKIWDSNPLNRCFPPCSSNRSIAGQFVACQNHSFDRHGNRLRIPLQSQTTWTPTNMLQIEKQQNNAEGLSITEYYIYTGKKRTRKVAETKDVFGRLVKIEEASYYGNIEIRETSTGLNLNYDGNQITEDDQTVAPQSSTHDLRVLVGHRQIARQSTSSLEYSTLNLEFYLSNHIDSCQAILTSNGELKSFQSFYPYGNSSYQYGQFKDKNYQYSGEEKDQTGLHYYGARYYESENLLSWLSPDPSGYPDGHLNRYTMVRGNPVTLRDEYGLWPNQTLFSFLTSTMLAITAYLSPSVKGSFGGIDEAVNNFTRTVATNSAKIQYVVADIHNEVIPEEIINGIASALISLNVSYDIGMEGAFFIGKHMTDPQSSADNWKNFKYEMINSYDVKDLVNRKFQKRRNQNIEKSVHAADLFFSYNYGDSRIGLAESITYSKTSQKSMIHFYGLAHVTLNKDQISAGLSKSSSIQQQFISNYYPYVRFKENSMNELIEGFIMQHGLFDEYLKNGHAFYFVDKDLYKMIKRHINPKPFENKHSKLTIPYGGRRNLLVFGQRSDFDELLKNEGIEAYKRLGAQYTHPSKSMTKKAKNEDKEL